MKYLEIKNQKGFYNIGDKEKEIDQINKEDILILVENALNDIDFEMDEYSPDDLQNKAHQIIYENIYNKLKLLATDTETFSRQTDSLFKEAISKYCENEDDIDTDDIPF